jgi:hypothetical protein
MSQAIYLIHPLLQTNAIILMSIALALGFRRFRSLHLKKKVTFQRRAHIITGSVALSTALIGGIIGLIVTRITWSKLLMTINHGYLGITTLALLSLGAITGIMLHKIPKKRIILPLIHGSANTVGFLLALNQIQTGIELYESFINSL